MSLRTEKKKKQGFLMGLRDGVPICLGYISISFTYGMVSVKSGLTPLAALIVSLTNFTSAGQFAGTELIVAGGAFVEIGITVLLINARYAIMSLSLSQRVSPDMTLLERCVLAFGNTDEIFAVAMQKKEPIGTGYLAGLILTPYVGWATGTILGATVTQFLPASLRSALGMTIYAMFIAIFIPPARKIKPVALTVAASAVLSCVFRWTPYLDRVSYGWVIIICVVVSSGVMALLFPLNRAGEEST